MTCRGAAIAMTLLTGPLMAQTPSASDGGRVPINQQPNVAGSKNDDNRIPVLQGAGSAGAIQGFPDSSNPGAIQQPYLPPQPQLNPYLNLLRGTNRGGFGAIDYYNFVRPGQQAIGSYSGRAYGASPGFGGRSGANIDPETGLATSVRSAGVPASFQNYGSYFNRLGTIGPGTGAVAAPANTGTGRR